jgi:hypothetical protein
MKSMKNISIFTVVLLLGIKVTVNAQQTVLVEAENFKDKGGWVVDQQFMDQMGSPYLMAHGLGVPVKDAITKISFTEPGLYRIFVRTFNWTSQWYDGEGPGRFSLVLNGKTLPGVIGLKGNQWMWQDAGKVNIKRGETEIILHDLTGFNGRCDAIVFTKDLSLIPPTYGDKLMTFRKTLLGIGEPKDGGTYDFVVVGGGAAGICAAVSAARLGVKVALINDRPVLGGNNSSEIRVALSGDITKNLYPKIGNVLNEFNPPKELFPPGWSSIMHGGPAEDFLDDRKEAIVRAEKNISLFLNYHIFKTEMQGNRITSVIAKHIETGEEMRFQGFLFADCTGDANVGYLAGADYRMGRESAYEAFESLAPVFADKQTMGTSNLWRYDTLDTPSSFPVLDWAVKVSDRYNIEDDPKPSRWEGGFNKNTINDAEYIRDHNLWAIFGNWSYLKKNNLKYATRKLTWVAYIAGKRESRRLLGDIILNQNDIQNQVTYDDASFTTTWSIDQHFPDPENSKYFSGDEFYSSNTKIKIYPYHVPYRCLYSRNIDNLLMAGRDISVTHIALGTVRVQRTTAMMGEVVGMAASVCIKHHDSPRSVYLKYLSELKDLMSTGIPESSK